MRNYLYLYKSLEDIKMEEAQARYYLYREITVIGRSKLLCDIVIEDRRISSLHCTIVKVDGDRICRLIDGKFGAGDTSRNGVFVNQKKILCYDLKDGDTVNIGSHFLLYKVEQGDGEELCNLTLN